MRNTPIPPSPFVDLHPVVCRALCAVTCVRCWACVVRWGNRTPAPALGAPTGEPDCPPALGFGARLHVGYLLRTVRSVQQVDLPVRALNEGIDVAQLPRQVVG